MSLLDREAPPLAGKCALGALFLALPVKNGPFPAELKLRENTGNIIYIIRYNALTLIG